MSTTLTLETKKQCVQCALLHPAAEADPCPDCQKAIKEGVRSGAILNETWFLQFPVMVAKLGLKRNLRLSEVKDFELFRQSMNRSRTPYPIPGVAGTMTPAEWAVISRAKLQQYRRHIDQRTAIIIEVLIANATN